MMGGVQSAAGDVVSVADVLATASIARLYVGGRIGTESFRVMSFEREINREDREGTLNSMYDITIL
jgi:hypothetical protein